MNKNRGFAVIVLLLVVLILAIVGFGAYLYTQGQLNFGSQESTVTTPQNTQPQVSDLEKEANSITIDDVEAEFTSVDKDINSL